MKNKLKNIICKILIVGGCFLPILLNYNLKMADKQILESFEPDEQIKFIEQLSEDDDPAEDPVAVILDAVFKIIRDEHSNLIFKSSRVDRKNKTIYIYLNEENNNADRKVQLQLQDIAKKLGTLYDCKLVLLLDSKDESKSLYVYK